MIRFVVDGAEPNGATSKRSFDRVCDLGAGCGVIGITLVALGVARRATLVELDAEQAARCRENLARHALTGEVLHADVATLRAPPAALVVCNPPYFASHEGRPPKDAQLARARIGALDVFARAAALCTGARGRACFVYPARSTTQLLHALARAGLHAKRLQFVHPSVSLPARLVLVEAKHGRPGGLVVENARTDQLS